MPPPPAVHTTYHNNYDQGYNPTQHKFEQEVNDTFCETGQDLDRNLSKNSRMSFVKKVYGILFTQLFMTAVWIAIVAFDQRFFYNFLHQRVELLVLAIFGYITTLYALACYRHIARRVPLNYALLGIFTMCFSYLASFTTVLYNPELVFIAGVMTAGMVAGLTLYSLTTKLDYDAVAAFMWSLFLTLIIAVILSIFIRNRVLQILLSVLIIMILSIYIIYDTQLIIGERSNELSIDDYVFASMILYIDIMRLFLEILRLLGKSKN